MTAGEFRAWMDGFLRGKDRLSKGDIELIKAKSQGVMGTDYPVWVYRNPVILPYSNPVWTTTGSTVGDSPTTTTTAYLSS
jgi:hypothetical protein